MPLRLTPLEAVLSRLNLLPTPLFDTPLTIGIAKMLVIACKLDLFDILDTQPMSLNQLAERLHHDPQGLILLLQILVSAGYLRLQHGKYTNTRLSQRWLASSSMVSIAPYILHSPDIANIWDFAPSVIQTHRSALCMPYEELIYTEEQQNLMMRHYAGLASLATSLGREIIYRTKLPPNVRTLLDVGGSHAGYSALFCRRYPALQATILDLETGLQAGERTADFMRLEDRMEFVYGDIVRDDFPAQFPEQFDVALYFHIAHLLQPEVNQAVLAKVVQTLRPGGMLIFVDQVTDQTHGSRLASLMVQFMALTMATVGGTCYPFKTVKGWLEEVNMGKIRRYRLITPGASLITAIKQEKR